MKRDYRDIALDDFADDFAATEAALIDALRDRDAYRLALCVAIERLRRREVQNKRLQEQVAEMRETITGRWESITGRREARRQEAA